MKSSLSRRDFLKLAGLLPFIYTLPPSHNTTINQGAQKDQNVLILVFDAWSAANTSLYGYPRQTMPNLDKLAQNAIVYHNHYAGGHFTSPGTASLLTGTSAWTHQAFDFNSPVLETLSRKSIFNAIAQYHRFAYTHNPLVDTLLNQFMVDIDALTPLDDLYLKDTLSLLRLLKKDVEIGTISQNRILNQGDDGYSYSLYLSRLYDYFSQKKMEKLRARLPRGITNYGDYNFFILEEAVDWLSDTLKTSPTPFLGYTHLYPPHDPYFTRADFLDAFASDPYRQVTKEAHFLQNKPRQVVKEQRLWYDEFLLYVNSEIARLFANMERNGILENTWVFLTSDHGEMFERNILGHSEPVFFQPLIRIPLLVFPPGGGERIDIYQNTDAIDLLPTISHLARQRIPEWAEGRVLPPFKEGGLFDDRELSTIQVESIGEDGEVMEATSVIIKDKYKLVWYRGYEQLEPNLEFIELFDLESDPGEMDNVAATQSERANDLLPILKLKLSELNQSFQNRGY